MGLHSTANEVPNRVILRMKLSKFEQGDKIKYQAFSIKYIKT